MKEFEFEIEAFSLLTNKKETTYMIGENEEEIRTSYENNPKCGEIYNIKNLGEF